ncbi:antigen 5 like allergen Cul n 1 isoform X2 [Drosophila rhopaloa]|uniref:Venom allergen 5 isoform X2 n=1 Tax=Drosophila rhopaloa TaxID=1041015 RepID=A0A6P4EYM1_DRORH|nr:antigen 5 like allergen Cul n 1 isoform X2 [Drosophila rhopaloa]
MCSTESPIFKPLDYCNGNLCPNGTKHITCGIRFWGPKCGNDHKGIVLTHLRDDILKSLNDFRRKVIRGLPGLPKALKLPSISWDEELSVIAMRVSNQCFDRSNPSCVNTFRYEKVGESSDFVTLAKKSKDFNALNFFSMWFQYYKRLTPAHVYSFPDVAPDDKLRLFSNLIYQKNRKMGCGMLKSKGKLFFTCLFNRRIKANATLYQTEKDVIARLKKQKERALVQSNLVTKETSETSANMNVSLV